MMRLVNRKGPGAGEGALVARTALLEDLGLIPSILQVAYYFL